MPQKGSGPAMPKLTEALIERLECPPGKRDRLVFDSEQRGLAVRIMASGSKSYLAQYTTARHKHRVPLGSVDAISLKMARDGARAVMGKVALGENPAQTRRAEAEKAKAEAKRDKLTLGKLVDDWKRLHLTHRRESYAIEAVRVLKQVFADHWTRPAERLDRSAVVRLLDDLKPSIARVTVAYGRACFTWANKRGTLAANPFQAMPVSTATSKRERVLTDAELAKVWRAVQPDTELANKGGPFPAIVRVLILTGQRRDEVGGMPWQELSADRKSWVIPGDRTKNGEQHTVPLAPAVADLISETEKRTRGALGIGPDVPLKGLVFPGEGGKQFGNWSKMKAALDKASGVTDWRIHDLRRTLATGLQRLGVRLEVTEAVLNHVGGSRAGVVGVYQRHEWANEKRAALDAWATHVLAAAKQKSGASNVVKLRRA